MGGMGGYKGTGGMGGGCYKGTGEGGHESCPKHPPEKRTTTRPI